MEFLIQLLDNMETEDIQNSVNEISNSDADDEVPPMFTFSSQFKTPPVLLLFDWICGG